MKIFPDILDKKDVTMLLELKSRQRSIYLETVKNLKLGEGFIIDINTFEYKTKIKDYFTSDTYKRLNTKNRQITLDFKQLNVNQVLVYRIENKNIKKINKYV